jgi:hypothetical protein
VGFLVDVGYDIHVEVRVGVGDGVSVGCSSNLVAEVGPAAVKFLVVSIVGTVPAQLEIAGTRNAKTKAKGCDRIRKFLIAYSYLAMPQRRTE